MDENIVSSHAYLRYLRYRHMSETIVFVIQSAGKWSVFQLVEWFMPSLSIWACGIFSKWPALFAVKAGWKMNSKLKWVILFDTGACKLKLGSFDGTLYNGDSGTTSVTMSEVFKARDHVFI